MHMSDGIVNGPTSAVFGVLALGLLAVTVSRTRTELDDRTAPMAGLVAAFVFAVQMINFPVLPGVSGHLLGGALAAILMGPWTGALCVSIVLVVQSLLFADGGLTALGLNIVNMAFLGTAVGFGVALALRRFARGPGVRLGVITFVAALLNTVGASLGFVVEYALGGAAGLSLGTITLAMIGLHTLIGVGEGLITALTVNSVAATRPDLVYLLRRRPTETITAEVAT
jgi:cobalt/nickel transport system permease protein